MHAFGVLTDCESRLRHHLEDTQMMVRGVVPYVGAVKIP